MKKIFSLLAAVLFAGSMMADSYTISFKDTGTDSDSNAGLTSEAPADYIASGVEYVSSVAATGKVYNARTGRGLKFGNSSNPGAVTLTLASPVTATSIVVSARAYNDTEGNIKIQDKEDYAATTTVADYTYTYATPTEISAITVGTATKRGYIISVTVNYGEGGGGEEPTMAYYVAGSMTNWGPMAAYKLAPNPANEGEYMGEFTFAANDEFKVGYSDGTTIESTNYFPNGIDNNYVINEAGEYVVYFRPDGQGGEGWHYGFIYAAKKEAPIVHQYEVAEAIAAGLTDDTEIMVRGVVTKIEFKGKNFAKYGSANIYVADAAGAEGAFEFYNCYSLNADTFRTSSPEYDATSTAWAEFNMVADENGNEVHVGDTVIAFGKYKLYNTTHELNTGCYLVDVKHAESDVLEDGYYLVGDMNEWTPIADYMLYQNEEAEGEEYMIIMEFAANDKLKVRKVENGEATTWYPDNAENYTINEEGIYTVYFRPNADGGEGWYHGVIYTEKVQAVELNMTGGQLIVGEKEGDSYVQLDLFNFAQFDEEGRALGDGDWMTLYLFPEGETISDLYSVDDYTMMGEVYRVAGNDTLFVEALSGEALLEVVSIDAENEKALIRVNAMLFCENNIIYNVIVELTVDYYEDGEEPTEAIENTKVAVDRNKIIKLIEAGKVVIEKNGVKYSINGQLMK
jgi:hypothetical protein